MPAMNRPDADANGLTRPTLPEGHPLAARLATWVELRDQLADLAARLEYLNLMVRLERRKG
jgi:hypothetical protein